MRPALPLLLVFLAALPVGSIGRDSTQVDATKQNTQLAPTGENADSPLSTSRPANQRPFQRNEHLQEQRFRVPEQIERKEAVIGEKRASIDVKETRDKTIVDRKDFPKPEVKEHEQYNRDREKARIQPDGDQIKKYDLVTKYQSRIKDAADVAAQRQPKMEKRMSFESLNRFTYKRNGPGTENGAQMVAPAGSGAAPLQDTRPAYHVDWKRFENAK